MLKPILLATFFLSPLPVHALDTRLTPPDQLLTLGTELATNAGTSQWQQLWQRVRAAGYFQAQPATPYFTMAQAQLPMLAKQTLAQSDRVTAVDATLALYRRGFAGQQIGLRDGQPLYAMCLLVDWRSVPQAALHSTHAFVRGANLISAYPCD